MVSAKDYIEQTITICSEYFLQGWKNSKDGLPTTENVWYDTYTEGTVRELRYGGQDVYGGARWFDGDGAGQYWYGVVSHWKDNE